MRMLLPALLFWTFILVGCAATEPASPRFEDGKEANRGHDIVPPGMVENPLSETPADPRSSTFLDAPVTSTECVAQGTVDKPPVTMIHPSFDPTSEQIIIPSKRGTQTIDPVQDLVIRAQYRLKKNLDATLVGRSTEDGGVGLVFKGATAQLVRVIHDQHEPLSATFPVYRLEHRSHIEVVLSFFGPLVIAQIFDVKTGLELLSILGRDPEPQGGITQFWGSRPTLLTQRSACTPIRLNTDAQPVLRYVTIPDADAAKTSDIPHLKVREDQGDVRIYETHVHGIELAHCAGIELRDVQIEAPWKYVDTDYETYRSLPLVRAEKGFRVDLSYHSPDMVNALLLAYEKAFPTQVRLEHLGNSHAGRPIYAVAIGEGVKTDDTRPSIFLNGGHHGDEPLSTSIVLDAMHALLTSTDPLIERTRNQLVVWIVPLINPDGAFEFLERSRFDGRKVPQDLNGDGRIDKREGVDLNRNYPLQWGTLSHIEIEDTFGKWYRGPHPASESETQAIMALANREHFVSSISFHTGTTAVLAPYTISTLMDPLPNETLKMAEDLSIAMGKDSNGRRFPYRKNLYEVEGTDQDWMRHSHGTAAFLIEAARTSPIGYCARKDAIEPSRRAWRTLLSRTLDGPFVYGYAPGQEVRLGGQELRAGEVRNTRPRDGFWGLYIPSELLREGKVPIIQSNPKSASEAIRMDVQILPGMTHVAP